MLLIPKRMGLAWDKLPFRARVAVNLLLNGFIQNTNPIWVKICLHVAVPPLLRMPLLEEGFSILSNWKKIVGCGVSDILKLPPIYDVIEVDGGTCRWCNGIIQR